MIPPGALVRRVLVLLQVDRLLPVYSSVKEALRPLAGPEHPLVPWHPRAKLGRPPGSGQNAGETDA